MTIRELTKILRKNPYRTIALVIADACMLFIAAGLAFLLRFEGLIPTEYLSSLETLILLNITIVIPLFFWQRLYSLSLSFVSVRDLFRILKAIGLATILCFLAATLLRDYRVVELFPRSTILINGLFSIVLLGLVRIAKRMAKELQSSRSGKRILIVGAEHEGAQLAHTLLGTHTYHVVGFLDDNLVKMHTTIHDIPTLGTIADIGRIFQAHKIDEVIITDSVNVKRVIETARNQDIDLGRLKVLPSLHDVLDGRVTLSNLRDIALADLLGRESIKIDTGLMRAFLHGKRVLVTGAAGSIGSHLVLEILAFNPALLVTVDQNETGMFYLERKIQHVHPAAQTRMFIADVCDEQRIMQICSETKPDIIFHAAAYKHVSVMEANPFEAIKNNIFGTHTMARVARATGVQKFVLISTDKAVRPVSVMGATKHICEMICVNFHKLGTTKFCAVRFGNVLDSQGNAIEIFREQIKKGGPIEVTHPDMKRYFMVTSEACLLVMQAGALSSDGEIFCLDMGQPVKVVDLAKEMVRLAGYEPDKDIQIIFTRPRPGERLAEELLIEGEIPTKNEKIFIARLHGLERHDALEDQIANLKLSIANGDEKHVLSLLSSIVKHPIKQ
ncbi:MAG: nucleoside-diphosphate sugar epimerase/dehydratase [bacterium]|nr:nucleoside-diphosphate sugar epimerase/dehydratase [bacterium]